jgi:hypothetical protein
VKVEQNKGGRGDLQQVKTKNSSIVGMWVLMYRAMHRRRRGCVYMDLHMY